MKQFVVIFSKPVVLPGDNLEKIKTYGILFQKSEISTFDLIEKYLRNYIFPIAEVFKDDAELISDWSYRKNGEVFYVNGQTWNEYVKKAEKKKIRFEFFGDDILEIKEEDYVDGYLLINKDTWKQLKSMDDIVWH
jgi:hypothetical protein